MSGIRQEFFDLADRPDKYDDGKYLIYYNIDPKLPPNQAMCRVVGVNPTVPNSRPIWRGDAVVVKYAWWSGPRVEGDTALHMHYFDIRPAVRDKFDSLIVKWYRSDSWADFLAAEKEICTPSLYILRTGHA